MWKECVRERSPLRKGPRQEHAHGDRDVCEQIRAKGGPDRIKGFDLTLKCWKVIAMLSARV